MTIFNAARVNISKKGVIDRGRISNDFLNDLVDWGKTASYDLFATNQNYDIYNKVFPELGPYPDPITRIAVMLHVLSVLGWFEASGDWKEGVDSSRRSDTTNENAEAGMWQVSWNNRRLDSSLKQFLTDHGIDDGVEFQQRMKSDHPLAMEFAARLLRIDVKDFNRINNGPVRKVQGWGGIDERRSTPWRRRFWSEYESIYPWLSRAAVEEIKTALESHD